MLAFQARASSALSKQRTAVLSPTPRGSQLTMSNRSRTSRGKNRYHGGNTSEARVPGPPGLKNSVPMRRPGSVAGRLINASSMVRRPGSA